MLLACIMCIGTMDEPLDPSLTVVKIQLFGLIQSCIYKNVTLLFIYNSKQTNMAKVKALFKKNESIQYGKLQACHYCKLLE